MVHALEYDRLGAGLHLGTDLVTAIVHLGHYFELPDAHPHHARSILAEPAIPDLDRIGWIERRVELGLRELEWSILGQLLLQACARRFSAGQAVLDLKTNVQWLVPERPRDRIAALPDAFEHQ